MINGFEYSWEDVQILIEGKPFPIDGAVALEYTTKKDHVNIYGRGDKPVAMGKGKKEFSGSLTILQSELEALQRTLPKGKDITNKAPFTIVVGYAPEGGIPTIDNLLYCRVMEVKKGMKTGDGNMEVVLPLAIGDINYNI